MPVASVSPVLSAGGSIPPATASAMARRFRAMLRALRKAGRLKGYLVVLIWSIVGETITVAKWKERGLRAT